MIGSHDTFTYLKPIHSIFNLFKRWWKCQCKTIDEQYDSGVRFFDIRVVWYKDKWYFAHGIVTLKGMNFNSLIDICYYVGFWYSKAIYRIVLERGSDKIKEMFRNEADRAMQKYTHFWRADIKSTKVWYGKTASRNFELFSEGYLFAEVNTWELPSHELHGTITKNNWYKISLKKEAKKINSNLDFFKDNNKLKQMIDSKDELYFLDYCTNEY